MVVSHEHGRGACGTQDALDLVAHLRAQVGIEARKGLVQEHQGGRRRHGTGDGNPLLLPTGELVRVAVLEPAHAHQFEDLVNAGLAGAAVQLGQAEAHVLGNREVRKERVILEDDADAPILGGHGMPGSPHDLPAHRDGA